MSKQHRKIDHITDGLIKVRTGDQEFVIAEACSHRQGRLVYGYVNDRTQRITCPLHNSTFDLTTGCPLSGPATDRLRVEKIQGHAS